MSSLYPLWSTWKSLCRGHTFSVTHPLHHYPPNCSSSIPMLTSSNCSFCRFPRKDNQSQNLPQPINSHIRRRAPHFAGEVQFPNSRSEPQWSTFFTCPLALHVQITRSPGWILFPLTAIITTGPNTSICMPRLSGQSSIHQEPKESAKELSEHFITFPVWEIFELVSPCEGCAAV